MREEESMKTTRPWQPHMREDRILNPFAPVTEASQPIERVELELEEDSVDEAVEDSATLTGVDKQPPPGAG